LTQDRREYTVAVDNILTVVFAPVGAQSNTERFFINVIAGKDAGMKPSDGTQTSKLML
jgi:hypothetical protein